MAYDANMLLCHLCFFFGEISVKIFACFVIAFSFFFPLHLYLFIFFCTGPLLAVHGLSLVELSLGYSSVVVHRLLVVTCREQALGARASVVVVPSLSSCGP